MRGRPRRRLQRSSTNTPLRRRVRRGVKHLRGSSSVLRGIGCHRSGLTRELILRILHKPGRLPLAFFPLLHAKLSTSQSLLTLSTCLHTFFRGSSGSRLPFTISPKSHCRRVRTFRGSTGGAGRHGGSRVLARGRARVTTNLEGIGIKRHSLHSWFAPDHGLSTNLHIGLFLNGGKAGGRA